MRTTHRASTPGRSSVFFHSGPALKWITFAGVGTLGLLITTLIQALRGQPLLAPDGPTWAVAATFMVVAAAAATWAGGAPVIAQSTANEMDRPRPMG